MKQAKGYTVLVLLLLTLSLMSFSQSLKFKHFTIKDGLSINTIHSIMQDDVGFIWVGTTNGLDKFDGSNFTSYAHAPGNSKSLSNNIIWELFKDNEGVIWVGTEEGLNRYNAESDDFEHFMPDENNANSLPNSLVKGIIQSSNGNIWVATYCGILSLYNAQSNNFTNFEVTKVNNKFVNERISCLDEDEQGRIWVGTEGGGLFVFDPATQAIINYINEPGNPQSLMHNIVRSILIDSKNNIWVGTASGLNRFAGEQKGFEQYEHRVGNSKSIKPGNIDDVFEDSNNRIWLAIDGGGLNLLNTDNTFSAFTFNSQDKNSISSDIVRTVYEDISGNLWVGTFNAGLNLHNRLTNPIQSYFHNALDNKSLSNSSVMCFYETKNNNLLIGTDGGGINLFDKEKQSFTKFMHDPQNPTTLSSNAILCMYEDKKGDFWVGTFNGGLNKFDLQTQKSERYLVDYNSNMTLSNPHVWTILEDTRNNFWVGTMGGGLNKMDRENGTFKHFVPNDKDSTSISSFLIWNVFEDSKNRLWISTHKGLNQYNYENNTFKNYQFNDTDSLSLSNNWVLSIFEDSKHNFWVSTYGGGLNKFNPENNTFKAITVEQGLPSNIVLGVIEDNSGFLWVSTKAGIAKLNTENMQIQVFDESYGLRSNELNIGAYNKLNNGELLFGSNNGLERIMPDQVQINTEKPRIVLTGLYVHNEKVNVSSTEKRLTKHISQADTIYLTNNDYSFSIEYAALNYFATEKYRFAYMLEGFDPEWNKGGKLKMATYTNLDPGEYIFKVKGSNDSDIWSEKATSVVVLILPAWWQTLMFKAGVLLLILFVLYLSYRYKVQSIQNQKQQLKNEVQERTIELYESNTQLEEMNQEINQQKEELISQAEVLAKTNKKLEKSTQQLEHHKNNLESEVKLRTAELEKAKQQAEESDRLKTRFLTNMSHEIRTPMNAIVGFSNLLTQANLSTEAKTSYVNQITTNTKSLLLLIDDILDLSLMESNLLLMNNGTFELNNLIDEVYLDTSISKTDFDLRLNNNVESANYILNTDRYRLKQILVNLMGNACKFTSEGYIEFSCNFVNYELQFSVKDTGIGISEENLDVIFNRFRKITDDKTKLFRGAGLGLAISKKIAGLLGGNIQVESEIGKGSTFMLTLPESVILGSDNDKEREQNMEAGIFNWEGKKVLVVEDEETNYSYLESAMLRTKVEIFWAEDGKQALDLIIAGNTFDLILMDIKMPVMNGYDATIEIKKQQPKQIIVAQTAYARAEDYAEIQKAGFDEYLVKPIMPDDLYTLLAKYLNQK